MMLWACIVLAAALLSILLLIPIVVESVLLNFGVLTKSESSYCNRDEEDVCYLPGEFHLKLRSPLGFFQIVIGPTCFSISVHSLLCPDFVILKLNQVLKKSIPLSIDRFCVNSVSLSWGLRTHVRYVVVIL